jgi:arabinogalactan oligomer/maltooligosaccharide transport system substrate-binding protein
MTLTRLNRLLPVAVGSLLILAACGSGTSSSAEPSSTTGTSDEPTASEAAFPTGDIEIELWTKEGDPQIEFVQSLADAYTALHPNVTFNVVNKDVELLREDMVNTALAPDSQPELLWTVLDHVGPFVEAGVVQPLDGQFDDSVLAEAAQGSGTFTDPDSGESRVWVAPISIGNQLMMYYNKSIIGDEAPADTDEMIQLAKDNTSGDDYGLVFNQTESFWLVPWLGGFGGSVFADDGVTPTLDTPEMSSALEFLYGLKYTDSVMPSECDYTCASDLFTSGSAAMIINGDWELANYTDLLGDDLGVAPIPEVTSTGTYPAPYIGGTYYMVPSAVEGDTLTVVLDFIDFTLAAEQQRSQVEELKRLPSNDEILSDAIVTDDPGLQGSGEAVSKGVPQPINVEMRCNFDAMNTGVRDMFGGNDDFAGIVAAMQSAAETCVSTLE